MPDVAASECVASAQDIASEIVDAFSQLYPKLALPLGVWNDLKEMIEAEIRFQNDEVQHGAESFALDPLYIMGAVMSGLRDPEKIDA